MINIDINTSKTPRAILSVSKESHSSSCDHGIVTVAARPHNNVQVFCANSFTINRFRDSSTALRMTQARDIRATKK